jgi:ATP-dependent DNA helicase PIF1
MGLFWVLAVIVAIMYLINRKSPNSSSNGSNMTHIRSSASKSPAQVRRVVLQTTTEIPKDFDFNNEFQQVFDLMENSSCNLFITGKAGTGKSTLLQYFKQKTKKKIIVLAPTGVAAIKVHGQTIHSFFKFPPRFIQKDKVKRLRNEKLIKRLDAIVIDEASMLRADLLDGIDYSLRLNREQLDKPFGGIQIIIFGDLFQLPPVVDRDIKGVIDKFYPDGPYFFASHVLKKQPIGIAELHKIYRQRESDFINLLNKVRINNIDESDLSKLNSRYIKNVQLSCDGVITLTTTNNDANNINMESLKKITNKEYQYLARVWGALKEDEYPNEYCLKLKKGAQVMLIKNDPDKKWVNGTIGEISELSSHHIKVDIGGNLYDVTRVKWEKVEYVYNEEEDKVEEKVIATFEQYPIKLAWAVTIHKSQGQNFSNVIIDLGKGAFTHGQVYVALSRCTTFEGIVLRRPVAYSDIIFDRRVYRFLGISEKKESMHAQRSSIQPNGLVKVVEENNSVKSENVAEPKVQHRLTLCCIKGKIEGKRKGLEEKISKYSEGIDLQNSRIEEIDNEIRIVCAEIQEETDSIYGNGLDSIAQEYENDPENREALYEYGACLIDKLMGESEKEYSECASLRGRLAHAKLWLKIYTDHMERVKGELVELENVEVYKNQLSNEELKTLCTNFKMNQQELESYRKGFDEGYSGVCKSKPKKFKSKKWQAKIGQIRQAYPKAYLAWSAAEDSNLKKLFSEGRRIQELSKTFERQPTAISSRLRKLGLIK